MIQKIKSIHSNSLQDKVSINNINTEKIYNNIFIILNVELYHNFYVYIYILHMINMRILKTHPLLKLVNSYVVDSPQPSNISYMWNMGSLLALCLIIQIITGITLAMHYNPSVTEAFDSVEHIMRDVNNGWLIRYLHANTASAFFFLVYLHIARGLYYGSYKAPRTLTWVIGTIIFILMIATAFLGYLHSPKWHELFLNISLLDIFSFFSNIINNNIFINTCIILFTISLVIFYLDNFILSHINIIKYIQLFSFIVIPFIIVIQSYNYIIISETINFVKGDNNVDLHAHGHVSVDKETGKAIGQGLNTIGSQIGLGAAMAGVGAAVAKGIAKSGMPPLQKAGLIIGASVAGGLSHSWISAANRGGIRAENITTLNANIGSHVSKFINDSSISPLQEFLYNGELMSYTCLGIVYILIIQLIFKLYLKDNVNLNLSKLLGDNINTKLKFYFNKVIKLNKQMSVTWIWFGILIILFGQSIGVYALYKLSSNLYSFIDGHISFNPNILNNTSTSDISAISIKDILITLELINYISLIAIVSLTILLMFKFHFNENINSIYIWLLIFTLILILAFAGYSYGNLYTNINSYVNMYINLINK